MKKWIVGLIVMVCITLAVMYSLGMIGQHFRPIKMKNTVPTNVAEQVPEVVPEVEPEAAKTLPPRPSNPIVDEEGNILSLPINAYSN